MVQRERLAIAVLALVLIGLPLAVFGYEYGIRPRLSGHRVIDVRAAAPENGGFQPDSIRVSAGETVTLRFHSVDVTHGIAIGPGLDIDLGHIDPGQVKEVTLKFAEAGTFTFYCNTWCSVDHWRMRGVVEVVDPANPDAVPVAQSDPVIERLIAEGIDIDAAAHGEDDPQADHEAMSMPEPSPARGEALTALLVIPTELESLDWRRTHTPQEAADLLAGANPEAIEQEIIDVVAYWWIKDADPAALAQAESLYKKNCAACHGETGGADGPAADTTVETPIAFSDVDWMWQRRADVLYAKLRRGGMSTDMPNFGTLLTQEESWALIDYLWRLALRE